MDKQNFHPARHQILKKSILVKRRLGLVLAAKRHFQQIPHQRLVIAHARQWRNLNTRESRLQHTLCLQRAEIHAVVLGAVACGRRAVIVFAALLPQARRRLSRATAAIPAKRLCRLLVARWPRRGGQQRRCLLENRLEVREAVPGICLGWHGHLQQRIASPDLPQNSSETRAGAYALEDTLRILLGEAAQ
ncbi:hypothetical protein MY1884_000822 [Beauveria asiatica]